MSYASIDTLQRTLSENIFHHAKDSKKAAGRALGTLIEIICYYLLKEWGFDQNIAIERPLTEYGNSSISHNVEFTLHPLIETSDITINPDLPITTTKIIKKSPLHNFIKKTNYLIDKDHTIRNACVIGENQEYIAIASLNHKGPELASINTRILHQRPYAMFECKRVGVEEGCKKGPQTIEKAKQGAYVAQNTSALQKIRNEVGEKFGIIYKNGQPVIGPYSHLLHTIINSEEKVLLKDFTLSIGVVSNHGNWFTSEDQNKELKVLAYSYDWLLFLSDEGLAQFITDLILSPSKEYLSVQNAFLKSYKEGKKSNIFTKVRMDIEAHYSLCRYFKDNIANIEKWFNIITPHHSQLSQLKEELQTLTNKNWRNIYDCGKKG